MRRMITPKDLLKEEYADKIYDVANECVKVNDFKIIQGTEGALSYKQLLARNKSLYVIYEGRVITNNVGQITFKAKFVTPEEKAICNHIFRLDGTNLNSNNTGETAITRAPYFATRYADSYFVCEPKCLSLISNIKNELEIRITGLEASTDYNLSLRFELSLE